jgi:hypothetical protein
MADLIVCSQIRSDYECFDHHCSFLSKDFNVICSFCEEGFTSDKALMDHLMMCGNKTDQCPNCEKYIRRAIFAYHYENNCANFEEPTADNEKHNKPQPSSRLDHFLLLICVYCRWSTRDCELPSL